MADPSVLFLVGTICTDPAREGEFNQWYNSIHIPEVCRVPGVKRAVRYESLELEEGFPKYIALYEMDGEQGWSSFQEHRQRQQKGEAPAFTPGPPFQVVWRKAFKRIFPEGV